MTLKEKRADIRYMNSIKFSDNKKLISNSRIAWARFNIPAVSTCPYACEACKKLCYALKAEKAYPNTKASRAAAF